MNSVNWYNIYKAQDRINLFYFFQKAQVFRSSYLLVKAKRVIFTIWLSLFFGQKLNSIKRKDIWLVIKFLLKRTSMDISQQIFHKRQNHNLFKCYKQQQFHQILELRTQSRENLPWIHPFTRPDTHRRKFYNLMFKNTRYIKKHEKFMDAWGRMASLHATSV